MLPIINTKSIEGLSSEKQITSVFSQMANLRDSLEEELNDINDSKIQNINAKLDQYASSRINVVTGITKNSDGTFTVKGCVISAPVYGNWEVNL